MVAKKKAAKKKNPARQTVKTAAGLLRGRKAQLQAQEEAAMKGTKKKRK